MKILVKEYEEKKKQFLEETTVQDFQKAVVSKAKLPLPKGKVEVSIVIQKRSVGNKVLKIWSILASEVFGEAKTVCVVPRYPGVYHIVACTGVTV